jgi:hypothetical protein
VVPAEPLSDREHARPSDPVAARRELAEAFLAPVRGRLDAAARVWLERAVEAADPPFDRDAFVTAFALAARRAGKAAPPLAGPALERLRAAGVTWPVDAWGADGLVRAALLLRAAAGLAPGELERLVDDCFRRGDTRERQAVLRTLALLPEPARFVALGVEACRTSVEPVFEAIACENPYPARHFPEPSFNQMVLKAVFVGIAVRRILGLPARITPDLRRMVADYASERRAAGRSVPADIPYLLGDNGSVA